MDTRERQEKRRELIASGYAWDMIDNWQEKTTLYWHIAKKSATGEIGFKKGTLIKNEPCTPAYILKRLDNRAKTSFRNYYDFC